METKPPTFRQLIERYLQNLGADRTTGTWAAMYPWTLKTVLGPLLVYIEEIPGRTVYCRFVEVDHACQLLNPDRRLGNGLNPFTGKWNHHFSNAPAERALELFQFAMKRIPLVLDWQI